MVKELLENFNPQDYVGILAFITVLVALVVSLTSYPAIINVAIAKNLMDDPDARSSHSGKVPNLGGIGMYIGIVVPITIVGALLDTKSLLLILGCITLLFFLGLKDDILVLSPRKKFIGQLFAALLLIVFTDTRISGLSGIMDITIMPYWISVIFTLFVYLLIINAFNLIDGIDGLAAMLALMASCAFCYLFYKTVDISMVVLSSAVIGVLIPFLFLNFSRRKKMFMGDTGSMILGFIISVFVIRFIDNSESTIGSTYRNSSPVITLAILFFPLLDTLRIFFIRLIILKSSPFVADKNHLHHRFLSLGFSHAKTTLIIVIINIFLILLAISCIDIDIHYQLFALLFTGILLYSTCFVYNWLKKKSKKSI
ncbi:glycosyltransferase family 4 protein [Winogradskyella flava]|uniref:glycosyltransferase family 4 protein n=1 Tax=Winogradskyella flava TaxID=1884876 RepID=UPI002492F67F|nr:MraY family glycosyltransferase [Winogradskyella flava]